MSNFVGMKDSNECSKHGCLIRDISVDSLVSNRESITLIWFDSMLTESNLSNIPFFHLRNLNDYILFYTQKSLYLEYLISRQKRDDHIIVISNNIEILEETHNCEQVYAILLIIPDNDKNKNIIMKEDYKKVVGIFEDQNSMVVKLQEVIVNVEHNTTQNIENIFSTFNRKERSLRDLRHDLVPFVWCHVFKVLIKAMPHTFEARQEMLDEYRLYYSGNLSQSALINEFERNYTADNAIQWYTKSCFLFRSLNKALRTENIEVLYTFRCFINDLSASLEAIQDKNAITRVYRGGQMSKDEIETYSVGTLVAVNGFLSTSRDLSVALHFISLDSVTGKSPSQSRDNQIQFVLFEIDINKDLSLDTIWADISAQSDFPDEKEVLFDLGTTFEIVDIDYDSKHCFWRVQIRPSAEIVHLKREYEHYIRQQMKETNATLLFGILLTDMGEYEQSIKYFQRLLKQMSDDHEDRSNVYYSIARAYRFTDQHEKALMYFRRAEQLQREKLPKSNFDLARTLAGIASVYYELHDFQQELIYYQHSMAIYQQILPDNHIEIARTFDRLGFAYANQRDYVKALEHYSKSLIIYNQIAPHDHPGPARVLYNMGVVYYTLGNMDQSIDSYRKALKMRETTLPSNHLHIAQSCYQMSVFYKEQHHYDLALEFAQRAFSIYEKKLPQDHKLIREVQDIIEILQVNPTRQ